MLCYEFHKPIICSMDLRTTKQHLLTCEIVQSLVIFTCIYVLCKDLALDVTLHQLTFNIVC